MRVMPDRDAVLVDPDWLQGRLNDPSVLLMEVDDRPELYHRGHLPGARLVSWARDLRDPVRRDLPSPEAMEVLWRRLGVAEESTVVFYGDLNNWLAAYGYWLFRAFGLSNVRLLDGGRQLWLSQHRPLTQAVPAPAASGSVPAAVLNTDVRASRLDVARAARQGCLLDVRTPQEYRGEWLTEPEFPGEAAHRPGHIPGATSLPWDAVIDLNGRVRPTSELEALYAAAGVRPGVPVVTYCRIGERSAHSWVILHDILGGPEVANYDGSWTEWGSMTGMPIQLGADIGALPSNFQP